MQYRSLLLTVIVGFGSLLLTACSSPPTVSDYRAERPVLDLRQYLSGDLVAHGVFRDRSGKVQRRFVVQMQGSWKGDEGVLDEKFQYLNEAQRGQTESRIWRLRRERQEGDITHYSGSAGDVLGRAVGVSAGNALQWRYTLKLPVDGSVYEVEMNDWMYLVDEKTLINHAVMSKWGFKLGEVHIVFTKLPASDAGTTFKTLAP